MNKFDEVRAAVDEARHTLRAVDSQVDNMARLIAGRLEAASVRPYILKELKKELRGFNIHTGCWTAK